MVAWRGRRSAQALTSIMAAARVSPGGVAAIARRQSGGHRLSRGGRATWRAKQQAGGLLADQLKGRYRRLMAAINGGVKSS